MEKNNDWPEHFDLFPKFSRAIKYIGHILSGPHELSSHGEHLFEHDEPTIQMDINEINALLWDNYFEGDIESVKRITADIEGKTDGTFPRP